MGTQDDKGKVIPFIAPPAAGRARSAQDEQAFDAMRNQTLAKRRGFDTVEQAAPAPVRRAAPPAAAPAPTPPVLNAARLSALFIASLDDLICKQPARQSIGNEWPRAADRQLEKVAADIVDMLFGFILDDPQVPSGVKEALLTAQMATLQTALREPAFFADWQHPARLLLNDIAPLRKEHADRGGDAAVFTAFFASGMARIVDELAPSGTAFAILHSELHDFVRDATQGASGDAWQRAEAAARDFLERPLPSVARDFVAGYWIDVLERTAERHADDSPQWQDALAVIDDLAWSLTAKDDEDDRLRLIALVPGLLTRLNRGLDLIDVGRDDRRPFFDALIERHASVLRVETTPAAPPPREESADEQVARLQRGDWVEFLQHDGSVTRERLTWISPQRGILVFSNHQGQGAIQIAPEDLVDRVRERTATLIFDQPAEAAGKDSA